MRTVVLWGVLVTTSAVFGLVEGCSGDLSGSCPTDPNDPVYDDQFCQEIRDAGADGTDGSTSKSPQSAAVCVPNAPDGFSAPQPFWYGAKDDVPNFCPTDIGAFGGLGFAELFVPPLNCPTCVCKTSEKPHCSPTPTILVRSEICDVAISGSVNFTPPAGWDGSCTNATTLAAGAECPPGSGKLCATSVYSGALPDPVDECEPDVLPVIGVLDDTIRWKKAGRSCNASEAAPVDAPCENASPCKTDSTCQHQLPPEEAPGQGWRWCVRAEGIKQCQPDSKFNEQFIVYGADAVVDKRGCGECSCSGQGGKCFGTLRVYEDEACSSEISADGKDSIMPACSNFGPAGQAIGSIEMTNQLYVPGTCKPSGGFAFGTAELDETKAVTWCCMPPRKNDT